jgi:hypothetical protein
MHRTWSMPASRSATRTSRRSSGVFAAHPGGTENSDGRINAPVSDGQTLPDELQTLSCWQA